MGLDNSSPNAQDDDDDNSEEFALLVQKAEEFKVEGNKCFSNAEFEKVSLTLTTQKFQYFHYPLLRSRQLTFIMRLSRFGLFT